MFRKELHVEVQTSVLGGLCGVPPFHLDIQKHHGDVERSGWVEIFGFWCGKKK